jgi:hypothetical protein
MYTYIHILNIHELYQVQQEPLAPAALVQQQQRWQKREQRLQHRMQVGRA